MKRIALVTGTSSGLGLETSILLAKNGYKVYATMRNLKKNGILLKRAQEESVVIETLMLDVTKQITIESCVNQIIEKEGRIDLLINNAGGGFAKTTEQASEEEMKWVTDLNYFGVVRCTKAVLPIMRKNNSGFIINISSIGGLVGQPFNELYCAAKFAVEGFTEAMATYLTDNFGIKFSIIEPGGMSSEFLTSATERTIADGKTAHPAYLPILQKYMNGIQKRAKGGNEQAYQTPIEVAKIVVEVAKSENPPLRIRTSEWAEHFCTLKTKTDPDGTKLVNEIKNRFLK